LESTIKRIFRKLKKKLARITGAGRWGPTQFQLREVPTLAPSGDISEACKSRSETLNAVLLGLFQGDEESILNGRDATFSPAPVKFESCIRRANYLLRKRRANEALQWLCVQYLKTCEAKLGWAASELAILLCHDDVAIKILKRIKFEIPKARHKLAEIYEKRGLIDQAIQLYRDTRDQLTNTQYSFMLQTMLKSPTITSGELLSEQTLWARKFCNSSEKNRNPVRIESLRRRKIRVGYHCALWNTDTIRNQLLPVLLNHDREAFEIFVYTGNPLEGRFVDACDHIRRVGKVDDDAFVHLVRQDGIDIFIECNGFSPRHRYVAMAQRCAPVQISYLNHTGTSGTVNVDYVIADEISLRKEEDKYFTEEVWRIPGSFFCFNFDGSPHPDTGSAPVSKKGFVTFGCFGSHGKINLMLLDWWAEILKRSPGAALYVRNLELTRADNRRYFIRQMESFGISAERLIVREGLPRNDLVTCYKEVDISLDTWPYNGGNTIAESLWQGVPVISFRGQRFSSAYGASLLSASGCPELIAESSAEYVQLAVELAQNPLRIAGYRKDLRERTRKHGFNDARAFAAKLEKVYMSMLSRARKAEASAG